jgi:hypothetical protein
MQVWELGMDVVELLVDGGSLYALNNRGCETLPLIRLLVAEDKQSLLHA